MLPRLLYDPQCAVCNSFAKLLRKNLDGSVELAPMEPQEASQAKEFRLELADGTSLQGEAAIQALEKIEPRIRNYFWMLPPAYRGKALVRTYRFGKWLRGLWGCKSCANDSSHE